MIISISIDPEGYSIVVLFKIKKLWLVIDIQWGSRFEHLRIIKQDTVCLKICKGMFRSPRGE